MMALVFHGPRDLRWEEWPDPIVRDGDVIVAVRAVGICGSDLHGYTGESGRRIPPMIMGHEFTGDVVASPSSDASIAAGTRVFVRPFLHCGQCAACIGGQTNLCRQRVYLGANANGAMAQRVAVPAANVVKLPDGLSYEHGTLAEPLAVAIHAARLAGDLAGRVVLVVGCGTIGLLTMIAAKRFGAAKVVAIDSKADRLQAARSLVADAAVDPADADMASALLRSASGREIDVAFDAVGVAPTFAQCVDAVRPGGLVVALGGWKTVPIDLARVVAREIVIHGSFNFTPVDFAEGCTWLERGEIDCQRLVTDRIAMKDGARIFDEIVERKHDGIKVVLVNEA